MEHSDFKKTDDLVEAIKSVQESDFNKVKAEKYAAYCMRLKREKNRDGVLKNPWFQKKTIDELTKLFVRVTSEGIDFDGVHVTFQSTGISYDYVAYKNRMLLVYPETKIDLQLVYEGDQFKFSKESGSVIYSHSFNDPFNQLDEKVIGGYCVIKNKRGEFIVILDKSEIQKHRDVARTDGIWKKWFKEMCMKTIIKKACKYHFQDVTAGMDELDNENYDLEKVTKNEIDELSDKIVEALYVYQGDDKEMISQMCADKKAAGEFTVQFAKEILKQLGQ